jgi:hypothetical protein
LSIEFTQQISDYLIKVNGQIEKVKAESYEKLKRKVLFNSGVEFMHSETTDDPYDCKKQAAEKFKQTGLRIQVQELNLDEK